VIVVVIAWAVAAAIALVLGATCGFELRWKSARLRRDLAELETTLRQLEGLQADLRAAGARLSGLTATP
jgi:hypothetical protein